MLILPYHSDFFGFGLASKLASLEKRTCVFRIRVHLSGIRLFDCTVQAALKIRSGSLVRLVRRVSYQLF